jgi:hydroxyacylglutathione hydrolase
MRKFVKHIPSFKDNYAYLITCPRTNEAAVVDPADALKVIPFIKKQNVTLTKILTTHKHWDHAGGNEDMKKEFPNVDVYGSKEDDVPACTHFVGENDTFSIGDLNVRVLFTPCHTKGHIQYVISSPDGSSSALFSGDTLFLAGCGRFFEGTADQMYDAMQKLSKLDPSTLVYCGHEYAMQNLSFALSIESENKELKYKINEVKILLEEGNPSVPSTIAEELSYNPFMRCNVKSVQEFVGKSDPIATMHEIRERKNNWK